MKVYINGKDDGGWAIDMIIKDTKNALERLSITQTKNIFKADIIHNIWWNYFLIKKLISKAIFYVRTKND